MRRLLNTGAAGAVGTMLRRGLVGVAKEMRYLDLRPIETGPGEESMIGGMSAISRWRGGP